MRNPEAEAYFQARSARDEVGMEFINSLKDLGEYEVKGDLRIYRAPYAVTNEIVFGGAAETSFIYYRLREADLMIAFATGAEAAEMGKEWARFTLFRSNWPKVDLKHWALRAYDFARTGE